MNPWTIAALSVVFAGLTIGLIRSVRRGRRRALYLIPLVVAVVAWRWADYRQAWDELAVATAVAVVVTLTWWFVAGRRLPPPSDDHIRVWTQDDPF